MGASSRIDPARRGQIASKRSSELARRQFGAIARRQLIGAGFTSSRIERQVRDGYLFGRYPGVYAWGRADLGTEGVLAAGLLFAGQGSALGGLSCLWWLELLGRRPSLIHLDAPGRKSSRQNLRIHHPREVERSRHRGLPVVSLAQALLAASASLGHGTLRLVLARAEFRHLLNLPSLQSALGAGRPGSIALRKAMDAHLPQLAACANGFERDFVLLCERHRLPLPEPNVRIGRYRPDMLWREAKLVVELGGEDAPSSPAQLASDERRQAVLERLGYTVIRFSWEQVYFQPEWVVGRLLARFG